MFCNKATLIFYGTIVTELRCNTKKMQKSIYKLPILRKQNATVADLAEIMC